MASALCTLCRSVNTAQTRDTRPPSCQWRRFLGYLPSFFAYPLFGAIIDASGGGIAAQRTVFALVVASCAAEAVFSLASHRLIVRRRRDTGWPAPIAVDVS